MIQTIQQGLKDDGFDVSISKLCQWFGMPRKRPALTALTRLI